MATLVSTVRTEICPGCRKLRLLGAHCKCGARVIESRLLSTEEAAYYLGTSARTIHRLVTSERLKVMRTVHKHWRFDRQDLDQFIADAKARE